MKVAMCFGTFDNFHPGHGNYLKQANSYSLPLLVVIARDEVVKKVKNKTPQENEKIRLKKVVSEMKRLDIAGKVVLGDLNDKLKVVKEYQPEIICLGYDQQVNLKKLEQLIFEEGFFCGVKRLKAFHSEKYKSSYCKI